MVPADARHRRRRLDPHPVRVHRSVRHQALVRPRAGLAAVAIRHGGARRADDAHGARRGADAERARRSPTRATGSRCPSSRAIIASASTRACADGASRTRRTWATPTSIRKWRHWCGRRRCALSTLGADVEEANPGFDRTPRTIFRRHWFSGAAYLLRHFTPQQKALMDPGLVDVAAQGAQIGMLELLEAVAEARRARDADESVPREIRSAPDAVAAARGVRRRQGSRRRDEGEALDRLDAVLVSVQPDAAAGGVDTVRPHRAPACPSGCTSSGRATRTRECCARRGHSNRCSRFRCRMCRVSRYRTAESTVQNYARHHRGHRGTEQISFCYTT